MNKHKTYTEKEFAIKEGLGVNTTKVLKRLTSIIYNSNFKINTPGEKGFVNQLESALKKLDWNMYYFLKFSQLAYPKDEDNQLALMTLLSSRAANYGRFENKEFQLSIEYNKFVRVIKEYLKTGNKNLEYTTIFGHKFYINLDKLVNAVKKSVKESTLNKWRDLVYDLNRIKGEGDIDENLGDGLVDPTTISAKKEKVIEDKLDKLTDNSKPKIIKVRSVDDLKNINNPLTISESLIKALKDKDLTKLEVINIMQELVFKNEYMLSDKFLDKAFKDVMVLIPAKEYVRLLKGNKTFSIRTKSFKKGEFNFTPKNREELNNIIEKLMLERGLSADFNDIDVSNITDLSNLFSNTKFNGNISQWDVSNVTNMQELFYNCPFNGDISNWDVSNVRNMSAMFSNSKFNKDISKWDVSSVTEMSGMFFQCPFNGDISKWNVSNVRNMRSMFAKSKFNNNINNWDVSNVNLMDYIFSNSEFSKDISNWKIKNSLNLNDIFKNSKIKIKDYKEGYYNLKSYI